MKVRHRYYTQPLVNKDANLEGMARVINIVRVNPSIKRVAMITKRINDSQFLETFFNSREAPKLITKGQTKFPETAINIIHSSMDKHSSIEDEIVVALGLKSDELFYFEDKANSKFIVAVPWLDPEIEKWCRITNALESLTLAPSPHYAEPVCIVMRALIDMSSINKTSIPFHESDQNRVKTYFKALHDNKMELEESVIESYLYKTLNWTKRSIDEAFIILSAIKEGRHIKGQVGDTRGFFTKWQQACA